MDTRKRILMKCDNCKNEFFYLIYDINRTKSHCCSRKCANELKNVQKEVSCKRCNKLFFKKNCEIIKRPNQTKA